MRLVDTVKGIISEWHHLGYQVLYHGKDLQGKLTLPFDPYRETVLLTHGYGARGRSLEYIARKLHNDGFNAVPLYYHFWDDLEEVSLELVNNIREYHGRQDKDRQLHLIAHSMGGLVTCDASRIVPDLIASATFLGTPFGGTSKARFGIGKSAEQLQPQSEYLRRLLSDGLPEEIEYAVVQGTRDKVITLEKSRLRLDQPNITHYQIETGHLGLTGLKGYSIVKQVVGKKGI